MNHIKTEFIKWLRYNVRIRHYHLQLKNQVIEFMVKDKWFQVVRYDTKHGFAHKDIVHFDKRVKKFNLGISNYHIAMTFAEQDLKSNWERYIKEFQKEVKNHD